MGEIEQVRKVSWWALWLACIAILSGISLWWDQSSIKGKIDHGVEETLVNRTETLKNREETLKNRDVNHEILRKLEDLEKRLDETGR